MLGYVRSSCRKLACAPRQSRCLRRPERSPSRREWSGRAVSGWPSAAPTGGMLSCRDIWQPRPVPLRCAELVVFGDAIRAAGRAGLDLAGIGRHGQVGDERVFRFAGAVRNHRSVVGVRGQPHRLQRFGQRADLVHLDENRVADALLDALLQTLSVGDEEVVADQLDLLAERVRQRLPAVPIVFRHAVFDRDDRILAAPSSPRTRPSARTSFRSYPTS